MKYNLLDTFIDVVKTVLSENEKEGDKQMKKFSTGKVIVLLVVVALIALFLGLSGLKSHALPAQTKRVDIETLKQIKVKLEKLDRIEKASAEVALKGLKVTLDDKGRVFVKDTVEIDVRIADLQYNAVAKTDANVYVMPIPTKHEGFTAKLGLMYAAMPKNINTEKMDKGNLFLTFRPVHIKKLSLELVANTKDYGVGLGYKVVHNTKIIGGAVWNYGQRPTRPTAMPFIGLGLEF